MSAIAFTLEDVEAAPATPTSNPSPQLNNTPSHTPSIEDFSLLEDPSEVRPQPSRSHPVNRPHVSTNPTSRILDHEIIKELRTHHGEDTLKRLFWELLGYERVAEPLPRRTFSEGVRNSILEANLLARHEGVYILAVRLDRGRFGHRCRNAIVHQLSAQFPFAVVLFSDHDWSRAALVCSGKGNTTCPKPLRLWPILKKNASIVVDLLRELRAFRWDDSPRGTLDLAKSLRHLGEVCEDETEITNLPESPVDPDDLYDRVFRQSSPMKQAETRCLLEALAGLPVGERDGLKKEEYLCIRNRLILGHVRLCARAIKHFGLERGCKSLTWKDLVQEGIFGLAAAIKRFDITKPTAFSTYAYPWIRQAIGRAIQNQDRLIRIPSHCWHGERRLASCVWQRLNNILSISANERGLKHEIIDPHEAGPQNKLIRHEFGPAVSEAIEKCLQSLKGRQREVLERRFGLGGRKREKLQEIGDNFGLTRERIRQIERDALKKLRRGPLLARLQAIFFEGGGA